MSFNTHLGFSTTRLWCNRRGKCRCVLALLALLQNPISSHTDIFHVFYLLEQTNVTGRKSIFVPSDIFFYFLYSHTPFDSIPGSGWGLEDICAVLALLHEQGWQIETKSVSFILFSSSQDGVERWNFLGEPDCMSMCQVHLLLFYKKPYLEYQQ